MRRVCVQGVKLAAIFPVYARSLIFIKKYYYASKRKRKYFSTIYGFKVKSLKKEQSSTNVLM